LITFSNRERNIAYQVLQADASSPTATWGAPQDVDAGMVDQAVKGWNATLKNDGALRLK
jgi:hypothetical protein